MTLVNRSDSASSDEQEYAHRERVAVELAEQRNMINALRTSIQQLRDDHVRLLDLIEKLVDMDKPRAEAVHAIAVDHLSIKDRLEKLEGGGA